MLTRHKTNPFSAKVYRAANGNGKQLIRREAYRADSGGTGTAL
jgi:hypothetical protein